MGADVFAVDFPVPESELELARKRPPDRTRCTASRKTKGLKRALRFSADEVAEAERCSTQRGSILPGSVN